MEQIKEVERTRDLMLAAASSSSPAPALLLNLKGIGSEFAAVLWSEGLCRHFDNRRQIAAYAGLAPTPWQSSQIDRDQGVSKSGNPKLRTTLVQVAWLWLRHQPELSTHPLVQGAGDAERRAAEEIDDRRARPQVACCSVEIHHCWRRRRRGHPDDSLKVSYTSLSHLPGRTCPEDPR